MHLRDDTPLDAANLASLLAKAQGKYLLSPDGRLTRRSANEENGLSHADTMVQELSELLH